MSIFQIIRIHSLFNNRRELIGTHDGIITTGRTESCGDGAGDEGVEVGTGGVEDGLGEEGGHVGFGFG